jgi:DNA invertase Pin-like site-specific DNA recombinase
MPSKAYSYIRFSTPEQLKGDSLRRQLEGTKAYCLAKRLTLDESLSLRDLGVSGFKGRNRTKGALAAFLNAIHEGRVESGSVLIVESLDRLSREEIDTARETVRQILLAEVEIVTLSPERHYSRKSLNDTFALLEMIVIAQRAHEESAVKSKRGGEAWKAKKENAKNRKLTAQCPAWLRLAADRQRFIIDESKAGTVRRIFAMCIDGHGTTTITRRLNREGVKPIARAKSWQRSYVTKILGNRAVIGEYQPHIGHAGPARKPVGDPIPDYYPAIIGETDFYRAQQASQGRRLAVGKTGTQVANLFTRMVFDARNGSPMVIVSKGRRKLVSATALRGAGGEYVSFPYDAFEKAILTLATDLKPSDILPPTAASKANRERLEKADGELARIDNRLTALRERLMGDEDLGTLVDAVKALEANRRDAQADIARFRSDLHQESTDDLLTGTQELIDVIAKTEGEALVELRTRLKAKLRELIAEIWVLVNAKTCHRRHCTAQIFFRSGVSKYVAIGTTFKNLLAFGLDGDAFHGIDLRDREALAQSLKKQSGRPSDKQLLTDVATDLANGIADEGRFVARTEGIRVLLTR